MVVVTVFMNDTADKPLAIKYLNYDLNSSLYTCASLDYNSNE